MFIGLSEEQFRLQSYDLCAKLDERRVFYHEYDYRENLMIHCAVASISRKIQQLNFLGTADCTCFCFEITKNYLGLLHSKVIDEIHPSLFLKFSFFLFIIREKTQKQFTLNIILLSKSACCSTHQHKHTNNLAYFGKKTS